jgi:predicted ATPase
MINFLKINNFTEFSSANFEFSKGINVIIGENSTGKSHLLKLAYAISYVWHEAKAEQLEQPGKISSGGNKTWWQSRLAEKLVNVFKPDRLGNLYRIGAESDAEIEAQIQNVNNATDCRIKFNFSEISKTQVELLEKPDCFPNKKPIFFPAKEILSFFPGFTALYDERILAIEETYYDLCKTLNNPLLKHPDMSLIEPLEKMMGGTVKLESGRFFINFPTGNLEIFLVAEGLRKIAMLSYLIANGSINKESILFFDEPEANLNPKMIKHVTSLLLQLAEQGMQIILATHNLFLMKELSLQIENSENIPAKFFSLVQNKEGVLVEEGNILPDLQTIVALEEELAFFDREQAAFYAAKGQK